MTGGGGETVSSMLGLSCLQGPRCLRPVQLGEGLKVSRLAALDDLALSFRLDAPRVFEPGSRAGPTVPSRLYPV